MVKTEIFPMFQNGKKILKRGNQLREHGKYPYFQNVE